MKQLRVGIIGTGMRSPSYLRNLAPGLRPAVQVVALADPDEANRARFEAFFAEAIFAGGRRPRQYERGADLIGREDLDALIIASPNHAHAHDALLAMPRRIPILLEKPVAISLEECRRLWQGYLEAGEPPVAVGFVLRYAPFYTRVEELIREAELGQLLAIDADESIGAGLTAFFYGSGSWRRWDRLTGGFMVEKCCHDFDILNWLAGARAQRVFSLARRSHLTPRAREQRQRRFESDALRKAALDYGDTELKRAFRAVADDSLYEADTDVPDHQAVMIEYDNGILSTFTACLAQPRDARRLRVYGANGALEGDIGRGKIVVDKPSEEGGGSDSREFAVATGEGGHHGADPLINEAFWNRALGLPGTIRAGIREGIEAVLVGLAAEESKKSGLPVDVAWMRRAVFGADA